MKPRFDKKDSAVSEIIGTILIFGIIIVLFTTFITVYIPEIGTRNDSAFQTGTQNSLQAFSSQLLSTNTINGTHVSYSIPMGIQSAFFNPSTSSVLGYSNSSFSMSLSYNLSIGIQFTGAPPPSLAKYKSAANISVGRNPTGVAFDSVNDQMFILNSNYTGLLNAMTSYYYNQSNIKAWSNSPSSGPWHPPAGMLPNGTLTVVAAQNNTVLSNVSLVGYPTGIAFDPKDNLLFVSEANVSSLPASVLDGNATIHYKQHDLVSTTSSTIFRSGFVQVFNGSTFKQDKIFRFASVPIDLTYVSDLNQVYVSTDYANNNSSSQGVLSKQGNAHYNYYSYSGGETVIIGGGKTPTIENAMVVAQIGGITAPSGIFYDPANGYVYLQLVKYLPNLQKQATNGKYKFTLNTTGVPMEVLNPLTSSILSQRLDVTSSWSLAFDLSDGDIYSTNSSYFANNTPSGKSVSVVDGANGTVSKLNHTFYAPTSLVYDPANHFFYIANYNTSTVSIVNGLNGTFVGDVPGYNINAAGQNVSMGPGNGFTAMAVDSIDREIFVANYLTDTVSVIPDHTAIQSSTFSSLFHFKSTDTLYSNGSIYDTGSTSFMQPVTYAIENGYVVQQGTTSGSTTGLPITFNLSGTLPTFSATMVNLNGYNQSIVQTSSYLLSGNINKFVSPYFKDGQSLSLSQGTTQYTAKVTGIALRDLTMTITSDMIASWNYSLYEHFNGNIHAFNSTPGGSWKFSNLPLTAFVSGDTLTINLLKVMKLNSVGYRYYDASVNL